MGTGRGRDLFGGWSLDGLGLADTALGSWKGRNRDLTQSERSRKCLVSAGPKTPADPVHSGRSGSSGARSPVGSSSGRVQLEPEMRYPSPAPPCNYVILIHPEIRELLIETNTPMQGGWKQFSQLSGPFLIPSLDRRCFATKISY